MLPVHDMHELVGDDVCDMVHIRAVVPARLRVPHRRREDVELRRPAAGHFPASRLETRLLKGDAPARVERVAVVHDPYDKDRRIGDGEKLHGRLAAAIDHRHQ